MQASLLPPNATRLERALESATARIGAIDAPIAPLWDAATCPLHLLPWLAWALSVDNWDADWPEAKKREAVARSIALHRIKGTPLSIDMVLADFDDLLRVVEWHETATAEPHTFEVHLPLVTAPGVAPGGERATAAFAEAVIREVSRVKPLREHFTVIQSLALQTDIGLLATARLAGFVRQDVGLVSDTSPVWDGYLQTEDGEPLEDDSGFLDTAP